MIDSNQRPTSRSSMVLVASIAAVAFLLYAPSWTHPFVYDDLPAVKTHPLVRGDRPWHEILTSPYWPPDFTHDPLYRPLTVATFRANTALFGLEPLSFHVTNSVLHACASCLVALTAARLWRGPNGRRAGWIAGLLFATHPVHAEAVALVVGRSELLAMIFIMLMAYVHLGRVEARRAPSFVYHISLSLFYVCACTAKEHGVLAMALIIVIDVWYWRRAPAPSSSTRERLRALAASHYLGLILAVTAFLMARWMIFGWRTTLPDGVVEDTLNLFVIATPGERVATSFALTALAFQLICLPVNLCPIWAKGGIGLATSFLRPDVLAGVAVVLCMITALVVSLRRGYRVSIPIAGCLVFLIIPCHFINVASWFFAERWLYVPTAMVMLACAGVGTLAPRVSLTAGVVIAMLFGMTTMRYQDSWRSNLALVEAVVARQPSNYVGLMGLCTILDRQGRLDDGAEYVERLMHDHPNEAKTWYFHAKQLAARGRFADASVAIERYSEIAQMNALTPEVRKLYDQIRVGLGQP